MIQTNFYISGSLVNPPQNASELGVELNYGKDQFPGANTVSITDFTWVRENYDLLMGYIQAGLTGDVGITEAPPFRIDLVNEGVTQTIFNGYLDLTQVKIVDRISITAKAVSHATVDWINAVQNSFTFEYLASLQPGDSGYISPDMYQFMPYVNSQVPNYEQAAIATLMIFSVTEAIGKSIQDIAELTIDAANPFTTVNAILKAIIKIAYLIVLIATLIKLIEDTIKFIVSPVKYHAGMYVRDLMAKAVEYVSDSKMQFVSDIWAPGSPYYNEFIIPEKLYNPPTAADNSILGFLVPDPNEQVGWFKGTWGKLLDAMKAKYNAKIVVVANPDGSGTVNFVRKDKNALPPSYQLPDIYEPEYTYNLDELKANYLIQFQIDSTDMNTEQNYQGTLYQVVTSQKKVNYQPFVTLKDLDTIDIPFARATRKTSLTLPETLIYDFLLVFDSFDNILVDAVNVLIGVVNAILGFLRKVIKVLKWIGINLNWKLSNVPYLASSNLAGTVENRLNMMLLSADHFNVPKVLILNPGSSYKYNKIDPLNDVFETAQAHWTLFHYVDSFIPAQLNPAYADRPTGNQYVIKNFSKVPFDWNDFLQVLTNNRIYDANGNIAVLESLKYYPDTASSGGFAEIKVRFPQIYTLNLQESFINPTGQ